MISRTALTDLFPPLCFGAEKGTAAAAEESGFNLPNLLKTIPHIGHSPTLPVSSGFRSYPHFGHRVGLSAPDISILKSPWLYEYQAEKSDWAISQRASRPWLDFVISEAIQKVNANPETACAIPCPFLSTACSWLFSSVYFSLYAAYGSLLTLCGLPFVLSIFSLDLSTTNTL